MALQTGPLRMIGLGALDGEPHDPDQPPLHAGIHLRWALPREAGFPWHGFYLFRRKHVEPSPLCFSKGSGKPGHYASPLQVPSGVLTSDRPIVLDEKFAPTGSPEARLDERQFLRLTFGSPPAYQASVQVGFYEKATIVVTVFAGSDEVARYLVTGRPGTVEKLSIYHDAMTAIEFGTGPAALVELCYTPVAVEQRSSRWEPVPDFPAPLRLPVTSPAYPLTAGQPENLAASRALSRSRIRYGDADRFTAAPAPLHSAGVIRVVPHSPVVTGTATNWDESVIGGLLVIPGAVTAWTVAAVLSPTLLVLNRAYQGPALDTAYMIAEDAFGQLHDHLVHLVEGGPGGPAMSSRTLPEPVPTSGQVSVHHGSANVEGSGTGWGRQLEGLTVRIGRAASGTVTVAQGSRYVHGSLGFFNAGHAGLTLRLAGDDRSYIIERVYTASYVKLERPFEGPSASAASFTLSERDVYTITDVISPTRLRLDRNYLGPSGSNHPYVVLAMLHSEAGPGAVMPRQSPLDLALLGAIHPAVAQMLGLYWVDSSADKDAAYDYLVVADNVGIAGSPSAILAHLIGNGFSDAEAFIAYNLKAGVAPPLPAPTNLRVYALPASAIASSLEEFADSVGHAGLVWDLDAGPNGQLHAGAPVWYNLWRGSAGEGDAPAPLPAGDYRRVGDLPIVVAKPKLNPGRTPRPAGDWPPFALNAIDRGLPEGWFSHVVAGVDLFGRFSKRSEPAAWHQWQPEPQPRPWYYVDPPANTLIHAFAVRLLDQLAPPPPLAIEGFALDPADPTVLHDGAEQAWRESLPVAQRETAVGLRIRWQWSPALMKQAPDLREFRIYLDPGPANSLPVRTLAVSSVGPSETQVELDRAAPDGAYVGAALLVDQQTFSIVASTGSTLRVRNIGPLHDVRPSAQRDGRLLIPEVLSAGTVALTHDGVSVTGTGTLFTSALVGQRIRLEGDSGRYLVAAVNSATALTLNRSFAGPTAVGRRVAVTHPLYVDYARPNSWGERCQVVGVNEHASALADGSRQYEVFRLAPANFSATLSEPIARLRIGVSAADKRKHALDDPKWNSTDLGGRFGNEGYVGTPALAFRVHREPPPPPETLPALERVFASRADYHHHSFYSFRFRPQPHLKLHVFRALDEALFLGDLAQRPRPPLDPIADLALFPHELEPRAASIAAALNALNTPDVDLDRYRALADDALRVLAGLPGNERVFVQLTVEPIDADEPEPTGAPQLRWRDRRGPDDPDDYLPDAALRVYLDTLDGRAKNRYFYRGAFVDAVHNRGPLGLASPPIYLPKVAPPRAPSITKVLAGDRQITLRWSSNREADLQAYRVYRVPGDDTSTDLRRMALVHTEPVPAGDPAARVEEVEFIDSVTPLVNFVYRVLAVDDAGNASNPSRAVIGRAYDQSRPAPPVWNSPSPAPSTVALSWTASDLELRCLVQRSVPGSDDWQNLTGWLPRGSYAYEDADRIPDQSYAYRLRVLDAGGRTNSEYQSLIA